MWQSGNGDTPLVGDNTEKIWVHQFLAKPKMIAAGGLGGAVSPQGVQGKDNFVSFLYKTC